MRPPSTVVRLIGPPEADGDYVVQGERGADEEMVHLHDYEPRCRPSWTRAPLPSGAPVVFTIDERWTHTDAPPRWRTFPRPVTYGSSAVRASGTA
jgi:hypothetical protein